VTFSVSSGSVGSGIPKTVRRVMTIDCSAWPASFECLLALIFRHTSPQCAAGRPPMRTRPLRIPLQSTKLGASALLAATRRNVESARSTIRLDLLSSLASQETLFEEAPTAAGEVTMRILAIYEAGGLVTMCAWCRRVEIDGEWSLAPRQALSAIEARYTLSHSICPTCTLETDQPPASV